MKYYNINQELVPHRKALLTAVMSGRSYKYKFIIITILHYFFLLVNPNPEVRMNLPDIDSDFESANGV